MEPSSHKVPHWTVIILIVIILVVIIFIVIAFVIIVIVFILDDYRLNDGPDYLALRMEVPVWVQQKYK